jgi:hypothetical protein
MLLSKLALITQRPSGENVTCFRRGGEVIEVESRSALTDQFWETGYKG